MNRKPVKQAEVVYSVIMRRARPVALKHNFFGVENAIAFFDACQSMLNCIKVEFNGQVRYPAGLEYKEIADRAS